ncbi:hypothetical protein E6H32_01175 [Candidatus Bathyarchaeota archaeon]|nr:MAG: hypothetical protein E6H32_01175 [Candidatus Bathyarchaeota archaeon]
MTEGKPGRLGWTEIRVFIERRPWSVLSWSAGLSALAFIVFYGLQATTNPQVGIQFVQSEWPDPSIFPYFYAKPITWFAYFSFVYWAAGLESNKDHLLKLSPRARNILFLATALVAFASFYEIFYNFMVWLALEVLTTNCKPFPCNPDQVASIFDLRSPLNLVFATKIVTTAFGLSMYSLWFLHRVDVETERRNQTTATLPGDVKAPLPSPSRKRIEIEAGLAAQKPIDPTVDQT